MSELHETIHQCRLCPPAWRQRDFQQGLQRLRVRSGPEILILRDERRGRLRWKSNTRYIVADQIRQPVGLEMDELEIIAKAWMQIIRAVAGRKGRNQQENVNRSNRASCLLWHVGRPRRPILLLQVSMVIGILER